MDIPMNKITNTIKSALITALVTLSINSATATEEKPVQHLKLEAVKSSEEAYRVFVKDTKALKDKKELNEKALHEIHYITYSLEKSIAYYSEKGEGSIQDAAKALAIIVEDIHVHSENNRPEKTQKYLAQYFTEAKKFNALLTK